MLNPRSPIVNQLIGGGYQQYPPNNFPVGYNGYNQQQGYTGYYGNQVNYNYYNPIYQQNMLRQQQEEAEKQRKQQIDFNKRMSRIAHAEDGSTISEETLDKIYDPVSAQSPQQVADQYEQSRVASLAQSIGQTVNQDSITFMNRAKAATDYHNKFIDPKCGLNEFLNSAGELYVDGLLRDEKRKNRDLSGTYDSKSYKQLLNRTAPYAGKFSNNIDDNVVTLPPHLQNKLKSSYEERRAQFLASIMNSRGGNPNG